jgi:translation initiation factor 2 beta subunit (eIF-2beta)/eIF-5
LAQTLRQVGYVTPQGQVTGPNAPLAQQLKNYVTNVIPTAAQNLAQQRADIDAALTMGNQGIQVGDRAAFERQMAQIPNLMGLTAYHGTPHTIKGKFDISKVGTGEGAQAYGYGMYFAESPDVAKSYMPAFTEKQAQNRLFGSKNIDEAIAKAKSELEYVINNKAPTSTVNEVRQEIAQLEATKTGQNDIGNLYKVDIPDEYIPNMLDYDKPIKDQPEILKKIRTLIKDPDMLKTFDTNVESGITGANVYANYIPTGVSKFDLLKQKDDLLNKYMTKNMGMSDAVKSMNAEDRLAFSQIAQKIDDLKNRPKMASEVLNSIGIKGIRYLDQGSRGKGGTSNFVVFDPSDVKILEQNSKPMSRKEIIEQELEKVSK